MRALSTTILTLALLAPAASHAASTGFYSHGAGVSARILESIELCTSADELFDAERAAAVARGVKLAEDAVANREDDARAQFALFCNLGRQAEMEGASLDALATVERMEAAVDRALELEPGYLDALVGKGMLLIELPWMMGGDEDRGEDLLREALALDPMFTEARERLATFLGEEGRLDEMPT